MARTLGKFPRHVDGAGVRGWGEEKMFGGQCMLVIEVKVREFAEVRVTRVVGDRCPAKM